ncbi:hypothetical protein FBEOM_11957 [Fusarium beomiforme]|uniref:DUF7600 domain-containing protein n=1 Tax=Fusarium beomiforme TaxID=44412 RepID=A0A9P5A8H7_9HYPO|nr:hypothetical protein FBEOM_11957 [Fusarium beomiforme]
MKYCTLCGIPFTRRINEPWIENVRAVWVEGDSWNRTAISGVGRWGDYDDITSVTVPVNPQNRHDSQSGPGATIEVDLTPSDPTLFTDPDEIDTPWGYGFHESCWSILTKNHDPDLNNLFAACLSMPTDTSTLLDWGHDYGGASLLKPQFGMLVRTSRFQDLVALPQAFRSDPYHIPGLDYAIERAARLQDDVFLSHLEPKIQDLRSDSFYRLFPEVLQEIMIMLPTSDVRSLRLASPVFAMLELPARFWASRFQPGHEFDYLPEVQEHHPESWRALYLSVKIWGRGIPNMANRQRVWGIAKSLQATLTQIGGVSCQGFPLSTWFETGIDDSDQNTNYQAEVSWHTASRAVTEPGKSFFYGSRALRARTRCFPEPVKLRQMSVSFVYTAAGKFISGFSLIDNHDRTYSVGYQHKDTMLCMQLPFDQPIRGWELAMDISGIKGIAVVHIDGTLSSWAGESGGLPRWRLTGMKGVSSVKAEFDALKLVTLSRDNPPNDRNWVNNCLWYPKVPEERFLFSGSRGDEPPPKFNLPMSTVFFGESDGRYLSEMSEVFIWIFDTCHVAGIEFRFNDSSHDRQLGYTGPFDDNYPALRHFENSHDSTVSFPIDGPSGERLSNIEVQTQGWKVVGLKIHTNLGRSIQTPAYPWGTEKGWVTVNDKGSQIVGMFSTLARPLWDLGLISI